MAGAKTRKHCQSIRGGQPVLSLCRKIATEDTSTNHTHTHIAATPMLSKAVRVPRRPRAFAPWPRLDVRRAIGSPRVPLLRLAVELGEPALEFTSARARFQGTETDTAGANGLSCHAPSPPDPLNDTTLALWPSCNCDGHLCLCCCLPDYYAASRSRRGCCKARCPTITYSYQRYPTSKKVTRLLH